MGGDRRRRQRSGLRPANPSDRCAWRVGGRSRVRYPWCLLNWALPKYPLTRSHTMAVKKAAKKAAKKPARKAAKKKAAPVALPATPAPLI